MASQVSRRSGTQRSYSSRVSSRFSRAYRARFGRRKRRFGYRLKKKSGGVKKKRMNRKKMKKYKKKKQAKNLSYTHGYHTKTEYYGETTDRHCVYLKHSTFNLDMLAKAILGGLLRKLFSKSGFDVADLDANLSMLGSTGTPGNDARAFRLLFSSVYPKTDIPVQIQYDPTVAVTSMETIVNGWTDMLDYIKGRIILNNQNTATLLEFQVLDEYNTNTYKTKTQINCERDIVHIVMKSSLKIQNRTNSTTGSTSTDVVNTQPLHGYLYKFKHGDPRVKATVLNKEKEGLITGINVRGFEMLSSYTDLETKWQEPPPGSKFNNCVKVKKVVVPVGETQITQISYKVSGCFNNILNKLRDQVRYDSSGTVQKVWGIPGVCQMLALEEVIRTGDTYPITVGWEVEQQVGCWFTSKPKKQIFMDSFVATSG